MSSSTKQSAIAPVRRANRRLSEAQIAEDRVFKALAAPLRRAILDALKDQPHTTGQLCERFNDLDRCTVMQHLKVLEAADLVIAHRQGRERWNTLNPLPIKQISDRWIGPHAQRAVGLLARLADDLGQ